MFLHNVYDLSKAPVSLLLLLVLPVDIFSDIAQNCLKNKPVNTC